MKAAWKDPLYVLAGLAVVLLPLEWRYPYYFLQDDNRDYVLPWLVHAWRALQQGDLALYNFHQYSGFPSLGSAQTGSLYPPGYLAMFFSQAFFGHAFAAVDILVVAHLVLGALGWLAFFRRLGLSSLAAVWGALACDLNGFVIYGGSSWMHISVLAACYPWMLYFGLEFLRGPAWWKWTGLLVSRLLLFYYGYVQYFLYGAVLEILALAGVWLAQPGTVPKSGRRSILLSYSLSWIYGTLLSAPLLLPLWYQVQASANRRSALPFTDFVGYSMSLLSWAAGLLNPFSGEAPTNLGEALPFLGHVGYLTLFLAGSALYWTLRGRLAEERRRLSLVLLALLVLTLALSMGCFAAELYRLPVYNRFRWPFKLLFFPNCFEAALATLALDHFLENLAAGSFRRRAGVGCIALSLANCLALYVAATPKPFWTQKDRVPLVEPLQETLRNGKIFTLGFDVWDAKPARALGFNYATLWGLYHFAGYDALVPRANSDLALNLNFAATFQGSPARVPWDRLRLWGVRWYVVSSGTREYEAALGSRGMTALHRDTVRTVYRDPLAKPLVFWEDGRADPVHWQIRTNSILLEVSSRQAGRLCLNFLFHPRFHALTDGRPGALGSTTNGQILLEVPAGEHSLVVRYQDPDLRLGLWIAAVGLAGLAVHVRLGRRV